MDLNIVGFLKDGKYRIMVLNELNKSPSLPSELAKKLDINRASISRILRDLKEKNLIECTSDNSRTIVYSITKEGKSMLGAVK